MTPHATDTHDEHDEQCHCAACEREARERFVARARDVCALGGIAPWAHEALGPGWLEGDCNEGGTTVDAPISTEQLAQRTLGDVFENIVRLAESGRDKCRGGRYALASDTPTPEQLIKQNEADQLLALLDHALDYGRDQVAYLARTPRVENANASATLAKGDYVMVRRPDDARAWGAHVTDVSVGHTDVEVQGESTGERELVDVAHVRKAAV